VKKLTSRSWDEPTTSPTTKRKPTGIQKVKKGEWEKIKKGHVKSGFGKRKGEKPTYQRGDH